MRESSIFDIKEIPKFSTFYFCFLGNWIEVYKNI